MMTTEHGYYFEELEVGMSDSYTRKVTADDIAVFAEVSGDTNPVHLNEEFAANPRVLAGILARDWSDCMRLAGKVQEGSECHNGLMPR